MSTLSFEPFSYSRLLVLSHLAQFSPILSISRLLFFLSDLKQLVTLVTTGDTQKILRYIY